MTTQKRNARKSNANTNNVELHDAHVNAKPVTNDDVQPETFFVSLKNVIETHKIKTDPKLIRRVLRKYYAQNANHKHRDAWMFASHDVPNVVKLIDTHCRANKPATK